MLKLSLVLGLAAIASIPACGRSEPLYANFEYRLEGDHVVVPGTDIRLPKPSRCRYYIEDNGYYACIARQDDEFMDVYVGDESGTRSMPGGVVIGTNGYFRYMSDRDEVTNGLRLRLGSMFPQGRTGVFVDCISYDDQRLYAVRDGVETTYDYNLKRVGGQHGRSCTLSSDFLT